MENNDKIFETKLDFTNQYREACLLELGKDFEECSDNERYFVLAKLVASKSRAIQATSHAKDAKKVYYFSLEFLLGPLLDNYLINLGVRDLVEEGMASLGVSLDELCQQEVDPGLGNGGLGRLAACFLDSMAHEGIAGYGKGLRGRCRIFRV